MKWLRLHDLIYLILALVLAGLSLFAGQKLNDPNVGWLFGVFSVTVVIVQFMYVYELRNNISFFVSDYLRIRDKFLRVVVDEKLKEVQQLAQKAGKERIELKLDDLFRFVTLLVGLSKKLEAVDIRIERWASDTRAKEYFMANVAACRAREADISRIFVFNELVRPNLDEWLNNKGPESEDIKRIRKLLKEQKQEGINVEFIFEDQAGEGDVRDFGIFDDARVLDENFDARGDTKYEGFISSVPDEVEEYRERYKRLTKLAKKNGEALEKLLAD